jgi:hypothetical protein
MNMRHQDLSLQADQMKRIIDCVSDQAKKTRVAAGFLPHADADPAAVAVPNLQLVNQFIPAPPGAAANARLTRIVADQTPDLFLTTLSANVSLAAGELWDAQLVAALPKFRRIASLIARAEDALIFSGQAAPFNIPPAINPAAPNAPAAAGFPPGIVQILEGGSGLSPDNGLLPNLAYWNPPNVAPVGRAAVDRVFLGASNILPGVVAAKNQLEGNGYGAPFACALSPSAYALACTTPPGLTDLPRDLVLRVLEGGPLVSSSMIAEVPGNANQGYGLLVSLAGAPVELVVARDMTVDVLQISEEGRAIFRVSERVALRIKEIAAIAVLLPR